MKESPEDKDKAKLDTAFRQLESHINKLKKEGRLPADYSSEVETEKLKAISEKVGTVISKDLQDAYATIDTRFESYESKFGLYDEAINRLTKQVMKLIERMSIVETKVETGPKVAIAVITIIGILLTAVNVVVAMNT